MASVTIKSKTMRDLLTGDDAIFHYVEGIPQLFPWMSAEQSAGVVKPEDTDASIIQMARYEGEERIDDEVREHTVHLYEWRDENDQRHVAHYQAWTRPREGHLPEVILGEDVE